MKKLMTLLLAFMGLTANAQQTDQLTATLQAGDQTTVFYGIEAFKQAVEASPEGGVITLSPGGFNVPEKITKSLSIYGVGFETTTLTLESKTEMPATTLHGNLVIGDENMSPTSFSIEGVNVSGEIHTAKVLQSNFKMVKTACQYIRINAGLNNSIIRQSCIREYLDGRNNISDNLLVQNSYIWYLINFAIDSNVKVDHCVQGGRVYYSHEPMQSALLYTNCYIAGRLVDGATAYNCIFLRDGLSSQVVNGNCWFGKSPQSVYGEGDGNYIGYDANFKYMLQEPDVYIGNDGTQVGLHGGDYPWDKIPSLPRIIEGKVAKKTTADGHLKVTLKAEAKPVTE